MTIRVASVIALVIAAAVSLAAVGAIAATRQQAAPKPSFDVVSIKRNVSGAPNSNIAPQPGGRYVWTNATLRLLIGTAYQRRAFEDLEVIGGPDWINKDRFDVIVQTAGGAPPVDQVFLMLQAMLEDRFGLVVHQEMRERPVYRLMLARSDGRLGPRLVKSNSDCAAALKDQVEGRRPAPRRDGRPPCALGGGPGRMVGTGQTLAELGAALQPHVNRPVEDVTGLAGVYEFDIEFAPEFQQGRGGDAPAAPVGPTTDRPSIFTALQEQLGLKLESARGLVPVLVIDRAQPPSPD